MFILRLTFYLLLLTSLLGCTHVFFQPMHKQLHTPAELDVSFQDIYLESEAGIRLHGWRMSTTQAHKGTILFLHGNAENISTHFVNVAWLTSYGYDCYIFDYRGYGQSQGTPQIDGVMHDVDAMIEYVADHISDNDPFILMGHSLGAAITIYAAAHSPQHQRINAVVSVAAFSDYRAMARDILSRSWLTWALQWPLSFTIDNSYSPIEAVPKIAPVPLLIMHSREDEIIDFYHSQRLFAAAHHPKQFIEVKGDHNHTFNDIDNRQLLLNYLQQVLR